MKKRMLSALLAACLLLAGPAALAGERDFSMQLLGEIYAEKGAALLSPYGLRQALLMAASGAKGDTQKELLDLVGREDAVPLQSGAEGFAEANAAFVSERVTLLDGYLQALDTFGAKLFPLSDESVPALNDWVKEKTGGLVSEMEKAPLDENIRLILLNACALDADWASPFRPEASREGAFYGVDGEERAVFLHQTGAFPYAKIGSTQLVKLDYRQSGLAAYLLLPEAGGMEELLEKLASEGAFYANGLEESFLDLALPRLSLSSDEDLSDRLRGAHLPLSMGNRADFSGMDGAEDLYLEKIAQKARLDLDEEGTRAAAATKAEMSVKSALLMTTEMVADRPFVLLVRDESAGELLFAAAVGKING